MKKNYRLPSKFKTRTRVTELLTKYSTEMDVVYHTSKQTIDDINTLMSTQPNKHIIILIQNKWRAAKTIVDHHIGIVHDVFAKKKSNSAEVQSLVGRMCGHNKKMGPDAPMIYCDMPSVRNYISLTHKGFNYRNHGLEYQSTNINKRTNKEPKVKKSFADSNNITGITGELIRNDETTEAGNYIIVDIGKFHKGSQVYTMIEDVQKIIIEKGLIGQSIPVPVVSNLLIRYKYKDMDINNVRGNLWTCIRKNKQLKRTNKLIKHSLLYYGHGKDVKIILTL